MNRKRRTRMLIDYGKVEALKMAEALELAYEIETISPPTEALTMIKMRESAKNTLFYLGEVLITETKVRIAGKVGKGIVKGHEADFSRALAVIDAAFEANLPETNDWLPILAELEQAGEAAILKDIKPCCINKDSFFLKNGFDLEFYKAGLRSKTTF